jgi:hypothetical protein
MSRAGSNISETVGAPTASLIVVDGFLPPDLALELRRDIESHFANPAEHRPDTHRCAQSWWGGSRGCGFRLPAVRRC